VAHLPDQTAMLRSPACIVITTTGHMPIYRSPSVAFKSVCHCVPRANCARSALSLRPYWQCGP